MVIVTRLSEVSVSTSSLRLETSTYCQNKQRQANDHSASSRHRGTSRRSGIGVVEIGVDPRPTVVDAIDGVVRAVHSCQSLIHEEKLGQDMLTSFPSLSSHSNSSNMAHSKSHQAQ